MMTLRADRIGDTASVVPEGSTIRADSDQAKAMCNDYIEEHLDTLKRAEVPRDTILGRRNALRQLNAFCDFGLIYATKETIEAWMEHLRTTPPERPARRRVPAGGEAEDRGRSRATRAIYGFHVAAFFDWFCHTYSWANPCEGIDFPKRPKSLPDPATEDELKLLLTLPEPLLTVVILGAFGGGRRAEIAGARRHHITAETWRIPRAKGGISRVVPTHPFVWEHVRHIPEWVGEGRDRRPVPLVANTHGQPVSPTWITWAIRRAFDDLGLPELRPHQLRHRYGTIIHNLFGDLLITRDALGHRSVRSTEGYAQVAPSRLAAAVRQLPVPEIDE